jgi:hypothetical protein
MKKSDTAIAHDRKGVSIMIVAVIAAVIVVVAAVGVFLVLTKDSGELLWKVDYEAEQDTDLYVYIDDKQVYHQHLYGTYPSTMSSTYIQKISGDSVDVVVSAKLVHDGTTIAEDSKTVTIYKNELVVMTDDPLKLYPS